MKDLEKQIEEAGFQYNKRLYNPEVSSEEAIYINLEDAFIKGAISPEAKEYWFNTFIDEIIENKTFLDFALKCASKKYEVGSKEHAIATMSIKFGMGCSLTKEYWQQGMYSEEDLYEILNKFRKEFSLHRGIQIMDFDIKNFIEQNKKK